MKYTLYITIDDKKVYFRNGGFTLRPEHFKNYPPQLFDTIEAARSKIFELKRGNYEEYAQPTETKETILEPSKA